MASAETPFGVWQDIRFDSVVRSGVQQELPFIASSLLLGLSVFPVFDELPGCSRRGWGYARLPGGWSRV